MTTLKQDALVADQTYTELLMQDTKVNVLRSNEVLGIKVSKSLTKEVLVEELVTLFAEKPFYIINHLPQDEQEILSKLNACQQDDYVAVPTCSECSKELALQLHHLVVTKVVGDKQYLYTTNSIRQYIDRCAMQNLTVYPGMQEWKDTLDKLNALQKQIEQDVKFNPMVLPIQQHPRYIQGLKDGLKLLDRL